MIFLRQYTILTLILSSLLTQAYSAAAVGTVPAPAGMGGARSLVFASDAPDHMDFLLTKHPELKAESEPPSNK